MKDWWKYLIVAALSIIATSLFWTLTDFWRTTKVVNISSDFEERMNIYKAYIEHEEANRLEFEERKKELEEKFNKPKTDEEICDGLDNILGIEGCK